MESEAEYFMLRYEALRNEYGTMSHYVEELRELINKAALQDRLSGVQRDELLEVIENIDRMRRAIEGGTGEH